MLGMSLLNKQSTVSEGWRGTMAEYHLPKVGYCARAPEGEAHQEKLHWPMSFR